MNSWLENLKAGDKVILSKYLTPDLIVTIDKVTKNFVIISGYKYRKADGSAVSTMRWESSKLKQWTKEREEEILHDRQVRIMTNKIRNFHHFDIIAFEELEVICSILDSYIPPK